MTIKLYEWQLTLVVLKNEVVQDVGWQAVEKAREQAGVAANNE